MSGCKGILTRLEIETINFTLVLIFHFIFFCLQRSSFILIIATRTPKHRTNKHFNILLISPPPGVCAADRAPVDNTCSAECSTGGWSGCAGSAAATELRRSHLRCGPSSTGNHTADSYSWSRLLLDRCCLGLL